jgi:hypothetical protein
MKKLLCICIIMLFSITIFAQKNKPQTPGDHLRYASRVQAGGTMLVALGFVAHISYLRAPDRYGDSFAYYGPTLAMLGIGLHTIAFSYINNAGVLLNDELSLGATSDGIGLVYKF